MDEGHPGKGKKGLFPIAFFTTLFLTERKKWSYFELKS